MEISVSDLYAQIGYLTMLTKAQEKLIAELQKKLAKDAPDEAP
jgi:hypothetical protein